MILQEPFKKLLPILVGFAGIIGLWHLAAEVLFPATAGLPLPFQVFYSLSSMWSSGDLLEDIQASLMRILTGFAIALITAVLLGVMAARFSFLFNLVKTPMDILSSVPPIAWTPLAILWFGIGNAPAYFIVFLGAFFPIFINVYAAITKVDKEYIEAAKVLGASPTLLVTKVVFPASLPQIFTGIQTGIGVAWFNVIAAELIGVRSGLGYKIQLYRTLLAVENVIALMFIIGVLGFLMTYLTRSIGKLIAPWAIQDISKERWIKLHQFFKAIGVFPFHTIKLWYSSKPSSARIKMPEPFSKPISSSLLLEIDKLSFSFERQNSNNKLEVFKDVSCKIEEGEVFSIIGPNGSGKTTILKIVAGLLQADEGEIKFGGEKLVKSDKQRTLVFQNFALFSWMTCKKNIEFALLASRKNRQEINDSIKEKRIETLLADVDLSDFADAYPSDLSGGMQQRLAIARALAVSPKLLLLDEAFSSLDPLNRDKSQEYILGLLAKYPVTVLLVTHDLDEAVFMSDKVLILTPRPGKVKKIVEIKLPRPRTAECRQTKEFQGLRACLWKNLHTE